MKSSHANLAQEWVIKLEQQAASGKSAMAWCQEQNIPYSRLFYWKKRLNKSNKNSSFIEIADEGSLSNWMEITITGAKIILSKNFNRADLLRCLKVLGEM